MITNHSIVAWSLVAVVASACTVGGSLPQPTPSATRPSANASPAQEAAEVVAGGGHPADIGDGGPATDALLVRPVNLALDHSGGLFIGECTASRVRHVSADGTIATVAGLAGGESGFSGDGGPATDARLDCPFALHADAAGNLYIADIYNHRVRRVDPGGVITTIAGTGEELDTGDGGPATDAALNSPGEVLVTPDGSLLIASGRYIRRIAPDGTIERLVGTDGDGSYASLRAWSAEMEGGPALNARISDSGGMAIGPHGDLYFAAYGEDRVFRVDQDGLIHSFAGSDRQVTDGSGDGAPAAAARVQRPADIAFGPDGSMYILEHFGGIRKVAPDGTISTWDIGWDYDEAQGMVADDEYLYIADRDHGVVIRVPFDH